MHRFTMEQLKTWSDRQILRIILMDRQESLTNPYSPLAQKINELHNKLSDDNYVLGPLWENKE
jgi:hypothetical protein